MNRAKLDFFKIEAASNDFVVILSDQIKCAESEKATLVQKICDRHKGLGCDQLLEVTSLDPLAIQIWNQDGSKAEMCANGARAFLLLASEQGWLRRDQNTLLISGRPFGYESNAHPGQGLAPFALNLNQPAYKGLTSLEVGDQQIPAHIIQAPNPHAVVFLGNEENQWPAPSNFNFKEWGPLLEAHEYFPHKSNIEFVYSLTLKDDSTIAAEAKVWERGSGATLSSGSGSVAVATAIWQVTGATKSRIFVTMNGNTNQVWQNEKGQTLLGGPASIVAKGVYFL